MSFNVIEEEFPEAQIINLYIGDDEKEDNHFVFTAVLEVINE